MNTNVKYELMQHDYHKSLPLQILSIAVYSHSIDVIPSYQKPRDSITARDAKCIVAPRVKSHGLHHK